MKKTASCEFVDSSTLDDGSDFPINVLMSLSPSPLRRPGMRRLFIGLIGLALATALASPAVAGDTSVSSSAAGAQLVGYENPMEVDFKGTVRTQGGGWDLLTAFQPSELPDLIFADDFERGNADVWKTVGGNGSGNGWPAEVPQPWAGWDEMPQTSAVMVNTDGDDMNVSCTGSPGNLAGLTADEVIYGTANGLVRITANYCVIHDIEFNGYTVRVSGDHYVIRECDIDGDGRTTKNGLSLSGTNGVAFRNYSHHLMGNDRHCFTNGGGATNMWFIKNEGYACSGDGYQAGHQSEGNRPTNIYLVQNTLHENRENALDYKYVENVYAVENVMWGFESASAGTWCFPDRPNVCSDSNSGSDGSAVVIGSDGGPINSYHYRNQIYDSVNAIRVESAFGEIVIEGNTQYDISGRCLSLDKDGYDIQYISNECRDAGRGIFQNWRDSFSLDVSGNTFDNISGPAIEYETGAVGNASSLTNNIFRNTGPVIYNKTVADTESEINALPNASGNTVE